MTKEEKIKEAYGDNKVVVDKDGWVKREVTGHGQTNGMEFENFGYDRKDIDVVMQDMSGGYWWRLPTLRGINDNNGWTKIEKESDLPDIHDVRMFMPCEYGKPRPDYSINAITIRNGFQAGVITHWRPIEMVLNPIY